MFTGIIKEIGRVKSIERAGGGMRLKISCGSVNDGLDIGDSVAVNGVCLSVTDMTKGLSFDVVGNTFDRTGLKELKTGDPVNLEPAMVLGDKISGHMVSGHVDAVRTVRASVRTQRGWTIDITVLSGDRRYMVQKGSIAVDGVSLTIGDIYRDFFRLYIIPLTLKDTTLGLKRSGDHVNIEFDMMAKYAEKQREGNVTEETLRRTGFMD